MKKISAICYVKEGKLSIVHEDKFKDALKIASDGRYFLTLEKSYNKRSVSQNNSVFGVAYKILQECFIDSFGEFVSIDWIHEYCKKNLLPPEYLERIYNEWLSEEKTNIVSKKTGECLNISEFKLTTTKMRTVEMMEYYSNLQDFSLEYFETNIPDPDPEWKKQIENAETR